MIKVISIGTDRNVFKEGSDVRKRLLKQCALFDELHVVVFTRKFEGLKAEQLGNLWIYPTQSLSRWLYIRDSIALGRGLVAQRTMGGKDSVITVQDPFECGLSGFFISKKTNIPLHIQIHTDFLSPFFSGLSVLNRIRVLIARFVLSQAVGIRVVSERVARSVSEKFPLLKDRVFVLPVFSENIRKEITKPLRRRKKKIDDFFEILIISRLAPEKDFESALNAFRLVRTDEKKAVLTIIGEGRERFRIEERVKNLNLSDAVAMQSWQSDPSLSYKECDVVFVTSRFEGYGLVLLEAAAYGKPVVTTDVGIARELIPDSYKRFVCPVGDVTCLSARLKELVSDPKLCQAYGLALRASAKGLVINESEYWKRYCADLLRCISKS